MQEQLYNKPVNRRKFITVAGLGLISACGVLASRPKKAYAFGEILLSEFFIDCIVLALAIYWGLTWNISSTERNTFLAEQLSTWLNDAGASFVDVLETFANTVVDAGSFVLSAVYDTVYAALKAFYLFLVTATTDEVESDFSLPGITDGFSIYTYSTLNSLYMDPEPLTSSSYDYYSYSDGYYGAAVEVPTSYYSYTNAATTSAICDFTFDGVSFTDRKVVALRMYYDDTTGSYFSTLSPGNFSTYGSYIYGYDGVLSDVLTNGALVTSSTVDGYRYPGVVLRDTSGTKDVGGYASLTAYLYESESVLEDEGVTTGSYIGSSDLVFDESSVVVFFVVTKTPSNWVSSVSGTGCYGLYDCATQTFYKGNYYDYAWYEDGEATATAPIGTYGSTVEDYPTDYVIDNTNVVASDLTIGSDGTLSDAGSIDVSVADSIVEGVTYSDLLLGSAAGVLTTDTVSTATAASEVVVGTAEGAVTSTIAEAAAATDTSLSGADTTASGSTTTTTTGFWDWSELSDYNWYEVFPFSIPWDIKNLIDTLLVDAEFPDSVSIPIVYESIGLDTALEVSFENLKELRSAIVAACRTLYVAGTAWLAWALTIGRGGGSDE